MTDYKVGDLISWHDSTNIYIVIEINEKELVLRDTNSYDRETRLDLIFHNYLIVRTILYSDIFKGITND